MARTSTIQIRVDEDIKQETESILAGLGMNISQYFTLALFQLKNQNKIPFEIKSENYNTDDYLNNHPRIEQIIATLKKAGFDIDNGIYGTSADDVYSEMEQMINEIEGSQADV